MAIPSRRRILTHSFSAQIIVPGRTLRTPRPRGSRKSICAPRVFIPIYQPRRRGSSVFNTRYLSGYTNYGQIIGNAIGCEGRGLNLWTTYRFYASDNLQFHYRNQHVNSEFLEGGYLRDFDLSGTVVKMGSLVFTAAANYEHWNFPLLFATPRTAVGVSLADHLSAAAWRQGFKNIR
jgi:hypothetical protein